MKRTGIKRTIAYIICAVLVISCFTVAFAESDDGMVRAEGIKAKTAEVSSSEPDNKLDSVDNKTTQKDVVTEEEEQKSSETEVKDETKKIAADISSFKDVSKHWAKDNLKKAVEDGLLNGFEDGTLRPDAKITLAQMITILVRILKPELMESSGVPEGKWYTEYADKAAALGIIGNNDAKNINAAINRKTACMMIAEAFQLTSANPDKNAAGKYSDFASLSFAEKIVFASLIEGGYLQGYNGSLMLTNQITRAEFVTILYRIAGNYNSSEENFDSSGTVLSSKNVKLKKVTVPGDLWIDATAENVDFDSINAKNIVIRSDLLEKLNIENSDIDRLVISARNGAVDLKCEGINTTVIGSGGGKVVLEPEDNNIEITGSGRSIVIKGSCDTVSVSGDYNTIVFENYADVSSVIVNGKSNSITLNSRADSLIMNGKENVVRGSGVINELTLNTGKSTVDVTTVDIIDNIDDGIEGLAVELFGPEKAYLNQYMSITADLSGIPDEEKNVKVAWTINGNTVKESNIVLNESTSLRLDYYISASAAIPDSYQIGLTITYVTDESEVQTVKANAISIAPDITAAQRQAAIVSTIQTVYKGNRTTQWAIDNDYSQEVKELFVNYKGYSSSSQYLIWVNIGTQHTMVFQGSKGNWKLIRSGLVSTGAGDCTPRGVFQTTYKQTNWTTETYTVKPIVRFYGGGYAFHSRLYKPGTTTLKGGNNGVGYPLSHGCVRMQADDIDWLYNNVPNGTTVVIY